MYHYHLKRRVACLLAGLILSGLFAGCGGAPAEEATAAPTTTAATSVTSVTSAATAAATTAAVTSAADTTTSASTATSEQTVKTEKLRVWSDNAHEKDLRDEQVAGFNETIGKTMGIEIEYTVYGTGWDDTIKAAVLAGDAPELFKPSGGYIADFASQGYLLPLTDFPGGEELAALYKGSLIPGEHVFNGKVYTLPYNITTYKYVVNVDLFNKAGISEYPKTWAEMREAAMLITEAGAGVEYGFGLSLLSPWTLTSGLTRQNFVNTGHIGFDNAGDMTYKFSDFLPAIRAIMDMIDDGSVFPGFENLNADQIRSQFAEGNIGILNAASFDVAVYNGQFPAKCEWDVIDPPSFDNSGVKAYKETVSGTNLLGFGAAAQKMPEKAMEVYKYFYADDNLAEMYGRGLYIPFRQEVLRMAKTAPADIGFAKFANVPDSVISLPMPTSAIHLEGDTFEVSLIKLLTDRTADVKSGLEAIDKRYNEAVAKAGDAGMERYKAPDGWSAKK